MMNVRSGGTQIASEQEDKKDEPEQINNHSGTGELSISFKGGGGADEGTLVDSIKIIEKFRSTTADRLKPRTVEECLYCFKHFNEFAKLKGKTKKDLTGQKGKELIITFLKAKYPEKSWRYTLAKLKTLYIGGFGYSSSDWPIEPRRDLPKLPKVTPEPTPTDEVVRAWDDALRHEKDTKSKLLWLLIAQHGWRPQHIVLLRWEDVKVRDGKPWAIIAQSKEFKTGAPIIAHLAPDVVDTLIQYQEETGISTGPVFNAWDHLLDKESGLSKDWVKLEKKWTLPYLRPKGCRHWVSRVAKDGAGLSRPVLAALMGHDTSSGSWMSDWYDSPTAETIIEEQGEKLPNGPLGLLRPINVELVTVAPEEQQVLTLWTQYKNHEIGLRDLTDELESLARESAKKVSSLKIGL